MATSLGRLPGPRAARPPQMNTQAISLTDFSLLQKPLFGSPLPGSRGIERISTVQLCVPRQIYAVQWILLCSGRFAEVPLIIPHSLEFVGTPVKFSWEWLGMRSPSKTLRVYITKRSTTTW